ncbi:MAG: PQQ-dependent sugar dehydrogenase [Halobacteriota archaeon]
MEESGTKINLAERWWVFPSFVVEHVATGLSMPINLAFVPRPSDDPDAPLLYVTELYGQIKAIDARWNVHTYAKDLLNFTSDYRIPGTGECGATGISVDPQTGDLFLSMLYIDEGQPKAKVVRTTSDDGLKMTSMRVIIDDMPSVHAAHQIQAVTIGFDGKLYVNVGDGMVAPRVAQDDTDLRGKILRMNCDGSVPDDNPQEGSYVYAKGVRNPFGAIWRRSDRSLYISDNGPERDDRIAKIEAGKNYGWPKTMRRNALFWWDFTNTPTGIAFMQDGQFPAEYHDELFVSLFGESYKRGPAVKGKRIVKLRLAEDGSGIKSYDNFVVYRGDGPASPLGLAFGPDGLYFTDLYGEQDDPKGPPSGNIYRVRSVRTKVDYPEGR